LYGEITALCNEKGYCWATNDYFAKLYKVSRVSISTWVSKLKKKDYIDCEMIREGKQIIERRLKIKKTLRGIKENLNTPIKENLKDNITLSNITPNIYIGVDEIIDFWNSFDIVKHDKTILKKQTDKVDKIKKVISLYGIEKVKKTISNYAHIISNSDKYYFTHKWSLWDFCKRGFDKFTPESHADQNFKLTRRA
jgi:hypothetical protein